MQISFVSQWYAPEAGDGGVPTGVALALRDRGHAVDVLTGFPNYPTGVLHHGYPLRPYRREVLDSIPVHRAPLFVSHNTNAVHRAANYLSFAAAAGAVGLAALPRADVSLVYSSPITAAVPAMLLRLARRTPYVLLIQDMWPQSVSASGFVEGRRARRVEGLLHRLCDAIYRRAAAIAVTSPGMADLVAARGIARGKLHFVPNWTDESKYVPRQPDPKLRAELGLDRACTVMYAGNLGEAQRLDTVLDAARLLRENRDVGFALVGSGTAEQSLRARAAHAGLDNVVFVAPQPPERMSAILALGDVQLICLRDDPLFRNTLPGKLQSLLAAGRPILGSVAGDAAQIIERSGAGVAVPPDAPDELAAAVTELAAAGADELAALGRAGRDYYLANFSRELGARTLEHVLTLAANTRPGRAA